MRDVALSCVVCESILVCVVDDAVCDDGTCDSGL